MCAVLGYVSYPGEMMNMDALTAMIQANICRGRHAYGFSWIDCRGRLRCYKQPGALTDNMAILNLMRDARSMILHLRHATHGKPERNINNHPHACDGGWLIHNGWLADYESLIPQHDLYPVSECDSEVIALLIEESKKRTLEARIADAFSKIDPGSPIVTMGLWRRKFVAAKRSRNPLCMGKSTDGIYFASLSPGLPGSVATFGDGQRLICELSREGTMAVEGTIGDFADAA